MKLHLGCGQNFLQGWVNHDADVDIRRRLPWRSGEAAFIFAEHLIEHVTFPEGVRFLTECRRVLRAGGVLRLAFPDAERIDQACDDDLRRYIESVSVTAARCIEKTYLPLESREDCLRLLFCGWGHQSAWTTSLAGYALRVAGFRIIGEAPYGKSSSPELTGIEGHHDQTWAAKIETSVIEAT